MLKQIKIDDSLHRDIKVRAAMLGVTIRQFAEVALRHELNDQRLIDTKEEYHVEPVTD